MDIYQSLITNSCFQFAIIDNYSKNFLKIRNINSAICNLFKIDQKSVIRKSGQHHLYIDIVANITASKEPVYDNDYEWLTINSDHVDLFFNYTGVALYAIIMDFHVKR